MLQFNCPSCGQLLSVPDSAAGQRGKCRHCGKEIEAPQNTATDDPGYSPLLAEIDASMGHFHDNAAAIGRSDAAAPATPSGKKKKSIFQVDPRLMRERQDVALGCLGVFAILSVVFALLRGTAYAWGYAGGALLTLVAFGFGAWVSRRRFK